MKHKKHNSQRMQINIDLRHHLLIYYNFNFNFVNVFCIIYILNEKFIVNYMILINKNCVNNNDCHSRLINF